MDTVGNRHAATSVWLTVVAAGAAFVFCPTRLAAQVNTGQAEDVRWQRTLPAGPYSVVNTASGTLITTIPLARLRGPGGTMLDFTITHTSASDTADTLGQVAKRWRHTYDQWVTPSGNTAQRNSPGGRVAWWYQPVFPGPFAGRPGVRDDLTALPNNGGFTVTHKDQTTARYDFNRNGSFV